MSVNRLPSETRPRSLDWRLSIIVAVWGVAVSGGFSALLVYSHTPGENGEAPGEWPAGTQIPRTEGSLELLMFVHPRCVCTEASLDELTEVVQRASRDVHTTVVLVNLEPVDQEWVDGSIREKLADRSTMVEFIDAGGEEMQRFGIATSGHVLLYDADGRQLYSGGVTGSRGHVGDNAGHDRLSQLLDASQPLERALSTPVFGCSFFHEN